MSAGSRLSRVSRQNPKAAARATTSGAASCGPHYNVGPFASPFNEGYQRPEFRKSRAPARAHLTCDRRHNPQGKPVLTEELKRHFSSVRSKGVKAGCNQKDNVETNNSDSRTSSRRC